jgi:hypothetical protein
MHRAVRVRVRPAWIARSASHARLRRRHVVGEARGPELLAQRLVGPRHVGAEDVAGAGDGDRVAGIAHAGEGEEDAGQPHGRRIARPALRERVAVAAEPSVELALDDAELVGGDVAVGADGRRERLGDDRRGPVVERVAAGDVQPERAAGVPQLPPGVVDVARRQPGQPTAVGLVGLEGCRRRRRHAAGGGAR